MTFPGKNKKQQKKKTGGGAGPYIRKGVYNRVYYFVADGIITGGA